MLSHYPCCPIMLSNHAVPLLMLFPLCGSMAGETVHMLHTCRSHVVTVWRGELCTCRPTTHPVPPRMLPPLGSMAGETVHMPIASHATAAGASALGMCVAPGGEHLIVGASDGSVQVPNLPLSTSRY